MVVPVKEAAQVVDKNEKNKLFLNEKTLSQILLDDAIADKPVCVISIAGIYRGGKSFLLNFFLRYLNLKYVRQEDTHDSDWLQAEDGPIWGFHWQNGVDRHTYGILMWPKVFIAELPTGEEVAIVLLDTQGSFDNKTDMTENAMIFALSTLISSVQIYNLQKTIYDYDLTHLLYFSGYGQMAKENVKNDNSSPDDGRSQDDVTAPFQTLMFLIRDWSCPEERKYGAEGGNGFIKDFLSVQDSDPAAIQDQKDNVNQLFENIKCFLLPHPGRTVATTKKFRGELTEIDEEFKTHVQDLASDILSSNNLTPKSIDGQKITGRGLYNLILKYWGSFQSKELPKLHSLFEISVEVQHLCAMEEAVKKYDEHMKCFINGEILEDTELIEAHNECKRISLEHFDKSLKMGNQEIHDHYKNILQDKLSEKYNGTFKTLNDVRVNHEGFFSSFKRKLAKSKETIIKIAKPVGAVGGAIGGYTMVVTPLIETAGPALLYVAGGAVIGYVVVPAIAVVGLGVITRKVLKWNKNRALDRSKHLRE